MKHDTLTIDDLCREYKQIYTRFQIEKTNLEEVYASEGGSVRDFGWAVFQKILKVVAEAHAQGKSRPDEYHKDMADLYFNMTLYQRRHDDKKGNHTYQEYLKHYLLHNQTKMEGYKLNAEVISYKGWCKYCEEIDGKSMSLEDALDSKLIDASKCQNSYGCRTSYAFRIAD